MRKVVTALFIVCEGFNTPPFRALKKVLNPESNTLPKQHTSSFRARLLIGIFLFTTGVSLFGQTQADLGAGRKEIIVILDVSGSMRQESRFVNVQQYLEEEVIDGLLNNGDDFTLVTFGERVQERFSRTIVSAADRLSLKTDLRRLEPNEDFTDIGTAMEKLADILEDPGRAGTRRVILFITDGLNAPPRRSNYFGANISLDERFRTLGERISRGSWFFYVIGVGGETAAQDIAAIVPGAELQTTTSGLEGVDFASRLSQMEEDEQARAGEAYSLLTLQGLTNALQRLADDLGIPLPFLLAAFALLVLLLILLIVFLAKAFKGMELIITDGKETLKRKIPALGVVVLNSPEAILPSLGREQNQVLRIQRNFFALKVQIMDAAPIAELSPYKKTGTHPLRGVINLANGSQVRIRVR